MEHDPVVSSNLHSVGYNEDDEALEITFREGGTYRYLGVPSYVYQGLMNAPSKGSYFHQKVKGRYTTQKVR